MHSSSLQTSRPITNLRKGNGFIDVQRQKDSETYSYHLQGANHQEFLENPWSASYRFQHHNFNEPFVPLANPRYLQESERNAKNKGAEENLMLQHPAAGCGSFFMDSSRIQEMGSPRHKETVSQSPGQSLKIFGMVIENPVSPSLATPNELQRSSTEQLGVHARTANQCESGGSGNSNGQSYLTHLVRARSCTKVL